MERSSFFNAELKGEEYDRVYLAEDFARYFASFIGNGVFPNPTTNLQVIAADNNMTVKLKSGKGWINGYFYENTDDLVLNVDVADGVLNRIDRVVLRLDFNMTVKLKSGKGWINGYFYENTDDLVLNVDVADGVLNRIDRVVLRLDFVNREIKAYIKKGAFSSNAVAPTLQRDANAYEIALADIVVNKGIVSIVQANITDLRSDINLCGYVSGVVEQIDTTNAYEIALADIVVNKGIVSIVQANITDLRSDINLCGYVSGVVEQIDTTNLFTQFQSAFDMWFEHIKGQLSEDAAGKIQLAIDEINSELLDKEKKMKFINVPENSDLAEYFKTVDTIGTYRVAPGSGVTNVCTDLSSIYTFYYVYQTFVLGVTEGGRVFKAGFVNKTLGAWEEILTNKKISFKLTPKAGLTIAYQNCYAINNIVYINARVQMTDGSLFQPTSGNRELVTIPTKYCPTDATALQSWAASVSTIGIPGAASAAAVSDGRILVVNTGTPKTITISGVYSI